MFTYNLLAECCRVGKHSLLVALGGVCPLRRSRAVGPHLSRHLRGELDCPSLPQLVVLREGRQVFTKHIAVALSVSI